MLPTTAISMVRAMASDEHAAAERYRRVVRDDAWAAQPAGAAPAAAVEEAPRRRFARLHFRPLEARS